MSTYSELIGTRIESFKNDPTKSVTYTVTVASSDGQNRYFIDGVQQQQLRLYEEITYNFDYSAASSHPFRFSTTADGTHGGGTEYTDGVSVSNNITTITVQKDAPTLFYYCSSHSGMGGRANTPSQTSVAQQMWYNETSQNFKTVPLLKAWSSTAPLNTGRYLSGSFGTESAGVQFIGSNPSNVSNTEHYNGVGWSEEANYPAAGQAASGAGTQTAGIAYGGSTPSQTANAFSYDGSAWTVANSLPYTANNIASCGLAKTDVIGAVGRDGSSGNSGTNKTVTFDGTDFANGPNINTTRMFNNSSGAGTGTAALIVGGFIDPSPNAMNNCEEYDGVSWTATATLNVATGFSTVFGTQTLATTQVNNPNYEGAEQYNGTSWTALPNIGITSPGGLYGSCAGSNGSAGWLSSMSPTYNKAAEWNESQVSVSLGAWASGGSLTTNRRNVAGAGIQNSALAIGGEAPRTGKTELYNGSTWSEVNDLNTARNTLGATGTSTAAIAFGGEAPGPSNATETWNGSSWTTSPNGLNTATRSNSGFGTTSSAINMGGFHPSPTRIANVEEWSGSSWATAPNALPAATNNMMGFGIETAGVSCGGSTGSNTGATYEWGGSAWTTGGTMNIARNSASAGTGSQTAGLVSGGSPETIGTTEFYDGTSWSNRPVLSQGRSGGSGLGPSSVATAGLVGGGYSGTADVGTTEEFTGDTQTINVETLTQS